MIYNETDTIGFPYGGELVKLRLPFNSNIRATNIFQRLIRAASLIRQVRKLKRERRIDVCISFLEASNFVNILSRQGEKVIISIRSYLSREFSDDARLKMFRKVIRFLYHRADEIVVPAQLTRSDLINNFKVPADKLSVIYNFVDQDEISKRSVEEVPGHHLPIFSGFPVLINVGRISNPKAQWLLMPVLQQVKKTYPEAKLVILGDGPLKPKLVEAAMEANLKTFVDGDNQDVNQIGGFDVYLLGFTKNPYQYLRRSQLLLQSSVYEGFPNAIIEAMSCGLPVISSDCPSGPREILNPGSTNTRPTDKMEAAEFGILTPVFQENDPENYTSETARSVSYILEDSRLAYYQKQSIKRAENFDPETIISQWISLIERKNQQAVS